jgi:D-alanyl-lipoteichoic acid acyltransferase DltB (MBOAT superfamily)
VSLAWRTAGVDAPPIMRAPLRATSLSDFWGRRWNLGFSVPARRFLLKPIAARLGQGAATPIVFLVSGLLHELVLSVPARAGYGLPTAYFLVQGAAMLFERSAPGRWLGLGFGWRGRVFALVCTAAPAFWLFNPAFVHRVILPFLQAIGAT